MTVRNDSIAIVQAALSGRRERLGVQAKETIESILNLGTLHVQKRDDAAAIPLLEEGMRAVESAPGVMDGAAIATTLNNLGNCYARAGKGGSAVHRAVLIDEGDRVTSQWHFLPP